MHELDAMTPIDLVFSTRPHTRLGRHARFGDIVSRVLAGWTPEVIADWLIDEEAHPLLTAREIQQYRSRLPVEAVFQALEVLGRLLQEGDGDEGM
jgi:hypothetical protein